MVKELMHDPIFLAGKSEVATKEDLQVAQDLLDTLMAHKESCVGMAANMIGVWGQRHLDYIKHHRKGFYTALLLDCKLNRYLADINKQAPLC